MKGTRALNNAEIRRVRDAFEGTFDVRNRSLFMLGVSIGGRVSELIALKVGDVWQNNKPVIDFQFDRSIVKGGEVSRTIPVNKDGIQAIYDLVRWHNATFGGLDAKRPLFPSRKSSSSGKVKAANRQAIHKILKDAFIKAGLNGKLATHTMRKSFAQRFYQKVRDIYMLSELLGHKNVTTTQAYIGINYGDARQAVEAMSLHTEDNPESPYSQFTDSELVLEIVSRGYYVTKDEVIDE